MIGAAQQGGQEWDGVISSALQSSGVDGTVMLGATSQPRAIPFGLPALISAMLHFLAPEAPRQLRVYTYDLATAGSVLEVRGGRALTCLPEQLCALAAQLGVKLAFHKQGTSSSVLLTLSSPSIEN